MIKSKKIAEKSFIIQYKKLYFLAITFPYKILKINAKSLSEAEKIAKEFIDGAKGSLVSQDYDYKGFYALEWLITTDCNLNCKHCFAKKKDESGRYGINVKSLSEIEIKRSIDYSLSQFREDLTKSRFKTGRFEVFIIGGEPLLEFPNVKSGLTYLKNGLDTLKTDMKMTSISLGVMLVTNGLKIDDEIAKYIVDNNLEVSVSVDTPHNLLKVDSEGRNFTPKAIDGIKLLIKHGAKNVAINVVVPAETIDQVDEIFDYMASFGIMSGLSTIQMSPKIPPHRQTSFCGCQSTEVVLSDYGKDLSKCRTFAKKMIEYCGKYGLDMKQYHSRMKHLLEVGGLAYRCPGAQWRICVVPGGDIFPCQQLVNIPGFHMGNINQPFDKIKQDGLKVVEKFKKRVVFNVEPCKDCPLQTICIVFVDCPARCYLECGDLNKVPVHYCEIAKEYLEKVYCEFIDKKILKH